MTGNPTQSAGGLSIKTLLISSASAVIATLVVSQFWEAGTLFFTAMVPIAVAVVSEALRRPADRITAVAPRVAAPLRGAGATAARERDVPEETRRTLSREGEDPFGLREAETEPRRPVLGPRAVRLGVVTGLIAFLIGAAVVTASELALFDGSVGGGDRRTTLLGGSGGSSTTEEETETTAPEESPTPTPTPTPEDPEATPTPTPPGERTPTPTPTPSVTPAPTPAPGAAPTPAPPAAEATPAAP